MKLKSILKISALFVLINGITAFIGTKIVPYLGFFPYGDLLLEYKLPTWFRSFANFDGLHYILIVYNHGYSQYEQAFFPLYPIVFGFFSYITKLPAIVSALILPPLFATFGFVFFVKIQKLMRLGKEEQIWTFMLLLFFPTSFFFQAAYTEGVFFLLFMLTIWAMFEKKYILAFIAGVLLGLTRFMGLFVIIPSIAILFQQNTKEFNLLNIFQDLILTLRKRTLPVAVALSPALGFGIYVFYLWRTTGDPLIFFNSQPAFGANRSTSLIFPPQVIYRYIKIFLTAMPNFQYFISFLELVFYVFVGSFLLFDLWKIIKNKYSYALYFRFGLLIFSVLNILLPSLTGTLSSMPRYSLMSLSVYLSVANIRNSKIKLGIAIIFGILHLLLLMLFIQGYFVS